MKRLAEEDSTPKKRATAPHPAVSLTDLPSAVIDFIFSLLEKDDILRLLLLNKIFRSTFKCYAFDTVNASWNKLIEMDDSDSVLCQNKHLIHNLRITPASTYHEYIQNLFGRLLSSDRFPLLSNVEVNTHNSSYWLRHNKNDNLKGITLRSLLKDARDYKIFDMTHLRNFTNLTLLTLHNYHFLVNEEETFSGSLSLLNLHDCTWEYPFNIVSFNLNDTLENLCITCQNRPEFIYLERFLDFLKNPVPGHSKSIRNIRIEIPGKTYEHLTPLVLRSFFMSFPRLDKLSLIGWVVKQANIETFLANYNLRRPLIFEIEAYFPLGEREIASIIALAETVHNLTFKLRARDLCEIEDVDLRVKKHPILDALLASSFFTAS